MDSTRVNNINIINEVIKIYSYVWNENEIILIIIKLLLK